MTPPSEYRLLVIGNRSHSRHVLEHLLEQGWNVAAVVWASGDLGRHQAGREPIADLTDRFDIPITGTEDINSEQVREKIADANLDLGICVGWTDIIGREIRSIPEEGILGFHASHLPKGRGGAPVNWQIIRGDDSVGVSCFQLVDEVDHGDIYAQTSVPIEYRDDVGTVYNRLTMATCDLLDNLLPEIARRGAEGTPQSFAEATYFPQRKPADGLIDWGLSAEEQYDWIRAQTRPYPGAFTFLRGEKLRIWEAEPTDRNTSRPGGMVTRVSDGDLVVSTGGEELAIRRLQVSGEPPMWGEAFATKHGLSPGDQFDTAQFPEEWIYTGIFNTNGTHLPESNVQVGTPLEFAVHLLSVERSATFHVRAIFDDEDIFDEEMTVYGKERRKLSFVPDSEGSHLLTVRFRGPDDYEDVRRMKVYTTESG